MVDVSVSQPNVQPWSAHQCVQTCCRRVRRGELSGTRVVLKAYPSGQLPESDAMAANEVTSETGSPFRLSAIGMASLLLCSLRLP